MKSYLKLLDEAYKKLEEKGKVLKKGEGEIEIPLPKISYHGKFTYIENTKEILEKLRRDIKLLMKFLQKELNVGCKIENNIIIIQKKISIDIIKSKIDKFIENFVRCPICKKLDTVLVKKDRITFIKCEACGAESPVTYKI
ncbi:MAG: translation initiation factor IF-2 subunit beta [Candidatus Nanoclepta minutus]|uniref:Translation initiation factor IF-2 subunit beta n=1 Tax=Candidatus Nanoclepta minutus TaxID=1940235 RepID=A0A397WNR1_9ARCH|nr:MAG: translation initiation factor IF-2 subunit beta [Candidatus Nanoclepta minutus]